MADTTDRLILVLPALALLLVWLAWNGVHQVSPPWAVISRWARWIGTSATVGGALWLSGWTPYSLGVLIAACFLAWFLLETAYNWVVINTLSHSDLPLFPRYRENPRGDEWPGQPRFLRLKEWLRLHSFRRQQSLMAPIAEHLLLRLSIFENGDATVRLHLLFLPVRRGGMTCCIACHSKADDGRRLITDNIFLPYGGFYPDNWLLERNPWLRSAEAIYQRHLARMDAAGARWKPMRDPAIEQINADQEELERINRDLGFLYPTADVEERGRITTAGRCRVWQELWTLGYLGRAHRY
jgi:hypothetical protein